MARLQPIDIFCEDRGGQTEDGGIRAGDRLILRRKSLEAQHRAEYLHPNRYVGMASLAFHDADQAASELERCVTKLGFKGSW